MQASTFRRIVTMDSADLLDQFMNLLEARGVRYCVIGGQAVNAYVDPLVSLDIDVVVAVDDMEGLLSALEKQFDVSVFPHSVNVSHPASGLRIQIQTDKRYLSFLGNARRLDVLGRKMLVADLTDVLQGKIWAVQDAGRRPSKRQKDLADISRILEKHPEYRESVPSEILSRLL